MEPATPCNHQMHWTGRECRKGGVESTSFAVPIYLDAAYSWLLHSVWILFLTEGFQNAKYLVGNVCFHQITYFKDRYFVPMKIMQWMKILRSIIFSDGDSKVGQKVKCFYLLRRAKFFLIPVTPPVPSSIAVEPKLVLRLQAIYARPLRTLID